MIAYWELVKLSVRRQVTYRAATFAGFLTNIFFGLLRASVMVALFETGKDVAGMSVQDAITFTGLSQASIAYLSIFNWYEVINSVRNGSISAELLKPLDYFTYWMAQDFGRALVSLILRGFTIMAFYALVFDITTPTSFSQWIAFISAVLLAWGVSFSWRFLVNLAAFWTPDAMGFGRLFFALSWFLSGFLMPLRLLPPWFVNICYLTPFPHMINTTIEIYLGLVQGAEVIMALLTQVIWIVLLITFGQIVLRFGVRRLVIQGG
jgi:ABC-2 type transport system permease protein